MRPEEIAAFGELASEAAAGTAGHIKDMHAGIAKRVWSAVGPMAGPVRIAHDRIATRTYEAARGRTRALAKAGANVAGNVRPPASPSIAHTPAARAVLAALNRPCGG